MKQEDGSVIHEPEQILEKQENFFREIYRSQGVSRR